MCYQILFQIFDANNETYPAHSKTSQRYFRRAETNQNALKAEHSFYARFFKIEPQPEDGLQYECPTPSKEGLGLFHCLRTLQL